MKRFLRITHGDLALTLGVGGLVAVSTFFSLTDPAGAVRADDLGSLLPWGLPLMVLAVAPLLWRTVAPVPVAAVSALATTLYYPLSYPDNLVIVAGALALFTVVERGYRRTGWLLGLLQFLIIHVFEAIHFGLPRLQYALSMLAWVLVVLISGEVARKRREYRAVVRERAEEAARTREEELRRRASDERLRLAREVHDVVAHNISLINVQAGSALYLIDSEPERAAEALAAIKQASKETLRELRSTLGVLRAVDEDAPRSPLPGLDRLDELVAGARTAGVGIRLRVTGEPRRPAAGVDSAAYRIVQESLTNVVRHSGAGSVTVDVGYAADGVSILVVDDGRGPADGGAPGNGINGMRERAVALGGELDAGPPPGGGFRVRAWLPD
ncbi:sensor histidine kinase [Actinorugispora endophytica]|uniref:histidine kinase n=1 Tax=Actinorugispora endophytica TaxID=1605990 RepID=A0A4R6UXH0_9ACTN|nr:sensor histidine kinase [Actinorugispora endophytica]TDQ52145.1 signal transduction histidine kinase [Actinorugispora endophytica]